MDGSFGVESGNPTLPKDHLCGYLTSSAESVRSIDIKQIADKLGSDTTPITPPAVPAKTCLIVDDSQLVRTQMEMLLQGYQLGTECAEDAETALRMVRSKQYDLIFLDVILPEMDGYKACKLIKADTTTRTTPVVMLTSKRSPFNRMHGALVGCDRYLTKPVDPAKVHAVLQQYALIAPA
jgi:CheY-like chemotaxis protein